MTHRFDGAEVLGSTAPAMRVRATAVGNPQSNAIGQVELACTPAGLAIGLFGVGPYTEGYAVGALVSGTHFVIPYSQISAARAYDDQVQLEFALPTFPHDRLTLCRFVAGPGIPPTELRRRRLILHLGILATAALASLSAGFLGLSLSPGAAGWSALGIGLTVGVTVLGLGYAVEQNFLTSPPSELATRRMFVRELAQYLPTLIQNEVPAESKPKARSIDITAWMPRTAALTGVAAGALLLTGLIAGQRHLVQSSGYVQSSPAAQREPLSALPAVAPPPTHIEQRQPEENAVVTRPASSNAQEGEAPKRGEAARVERRCICDRADSSLWKSPIPKLSALLIERRTIPTRTYLKTHLEVAIVNNGDSPVSEITMHVQFLETRNGRVTPTKERPLYFEGPLAPGRAIKWSTEARGDSYELMVPDLGQLGPNGDGAAPAQAFVDLLEANHRPVRLHAARMLSYLGDARARDAALELKDALRAAEAPYLRRVLMATGELRVCDTEFVAGAAGLMGACVYNATESERSGVGLALHLLSRSLDVEQPLADPPALQGSIKWPLSQAIPAQSGVYVHVEVPPGALESAENAREVFADEFDLLE